MTEQEISDWVSTHLALYKALAGGVVFLEELPKSATGKVIRKELRGKYT